MSLNLNKLSKVVKVKVTLILTLSSLVTHQPVLLSHTTVDRPSGGVTSTSMWPMMIDGSAKGTLLPRPGQWSRRRVGWWKGCSFIRIFITGGPICFMLGRLPDGPIINA